MTPPRMNLTKGFILVPLLLTLGLFASVSKAEETPLPQWETSMSLGLNLTRGNSETTLVTATVESHRKGPVNDIRLRAETNYGTAKVDHSDGTSDTEVNVQNVQGMASFRKLLSPKTYTYVNLDALQDEIADIDYRVIPGTGAGYYVLRSDTMELSLEGGLSYVAEEVDNNRDGYFAVRAAQRFDYKMGEASRLWETVEYLASLRNTEAYLFSGEIGAEAALNAKLALRVVVQDKYNNTPASGKEENDLVLKSGIVYRF